MNLEPSDRPVDRFGQPNNTPLDATNADTVKAFHRNSDVDSSPQSQHHTLGTARGQASPGNHVHDGTNSPKLGLYQMTSGGGATQPSLTLTGSKGGNVALANLINLLKNFIDFNDTTT